MCREIKQQQFQNLRLLRLTRLGFSQWRHEFDSGTIRVKFMMDKVALGRDFLLYHVLCLPCQFSLHYAPFSLMHAQ